MKFFFIKIFCFFVILTLYKTTYSQLYEFPQNYFRLPLDIPVSISGTFGELRNNHFHSGIDFKTQEKEGYNVYAVADGYISRIRVSAWGFGNALYITHNNGYMSVYGHLQSFNPKITSYLRKKQYETQSFEQDLFLPKKLIKIKKGDIIALSGNSGSSEGPHLHFELRDIKTEKPINPLLFGYFIKDTIAPIIQKFGIFNRYEEKIFQTVKKDNKYCLVADTIFFSDNFYTGIEVFDFINNSKSKNGIYKLELYFDSILYQSITFNAFSFNETRYINALINYSYFFKEKIKMIQSLILPGNKLSIYDKKYKNFDGWFVIPDNDGHTISFKAFDFNGNSSHLSVNIKRQLVSSNKINKIDDFFVKRINFNKSDTFQTDGFKVIFPENSLYEDINLTYHSSITSKNFLSQVHQLHNGATPIHKSISIYVKPDTISENLTDKILIVRIDGDNKLTSIGGKYESGYIKTNINNFGKFALVLDTVAPKIKTLNFKNNDNVSKLKELKVLITDNLSGISNYSAFINDKWVLMEYDGKTSQLTYTIDDNIKSGQNLLKIIVEDGRKNKSELELKIYK